ncbi:HLH-domain-containing protein [Hesseltinella vesiculosa]|uniref:HLH-domain-containing protein n=1 Tax=Hesseltinella vesiculosa TaxID=101127 RepID=A0A1X2G4B6_9FUNG|nr:HLH-domain-containing protein [Hesseltinella vesiculosa]
MYSPTQQDFLDSETFQQAMTSQHTTVGAVPVRPTQRNSGVFNHPGPYHPAHQRQNSFGTAASIAMSPPRAIPFSSVGDPSANWFSTSMDSSSSFGQSPPMFRPDLIVSPSNSSSHLDSFAANEEDEGQQRNLQEMFEKRRRRRESHNAVERRRRDNINERIHELSTLLPEHLLETAPASSNVNNVSTQNGGKAINKGTILKLSVDHIKTLQEEVNRYKDRVTTLERMIKNAQQGGSMASLDSSSFIKGEALYPDGSTSTPTPTQRRHERVGSLQFQQQFGNLHIASEDHRQHLPQ